MSGSEAELADAQRVGGELSVIAIDVDDFKSVNDRDGHLAGDRLLRRVADVLRSLCRETDAAGRVGGDEFLLVMPGLGAEAGAVAQRVVEHTYSRTGVRGLGGRRMHEAGRAGCRLADRPGGRSAAGREGGRQGHFQAFRLIGRSRADNAPAYPGSTLSAYLSGKVRRSAACSSMQRCDRPASSRASAR